MNMREGWHTIREASQLSGMPESTLRYYEQEGIIGPIARDPSSRHRLYSDEDIQVLVSISCLQATGMPLVNIRKYIVAAADGQRSALRQIELLEEQAEHLREQMNDLLNQQRYLAFKQKYWRAIAEQDEEGACKIREENQDLVHQVSHQQHRAMVETARSALRQMAKSKHTVNL